MFTNNYILYRRMMFFGGSTTGMTDHTGANKNPNASYSYNADFGYYMNVARLGGDLANKYGGVYFGTGTTAPQKSDYCLESPIATGLSIASGTVLTGYNGDGKGEASVTWSVKNTSDADITISEMGYFGRPNNSSTSSNGWLSLFERTVLDNPITIPPGVTKLVTYKITFNHG